MKTTAKAKIILINLSIMAMVMLPLLSFAQDDDQPCNATDPDAICPLDTYVWLFFAITLIAGALYLYKQQKAQQING